MGYWDWDAEIMR